jgi:hypothetical protein
MIKEVLAIILHVAGISEEFSCCQTLLFDNEEARGMRLVGKSLDLVHNLSSRGVAVSLLECFLAVLGPEHGRVCDSLGALVVIGCNDC